MFERRDFIKSAGIGLGLFVANRLSSEERGVENLLKYADPIQTNNDSLYAANNLDSLTNNQAIPHHLYSNKILPKGLKKGSKIAISAPASPTAMSEVVTAIKLFKSLGMNTVVGETITKRNSNFRYFSDSDKRRADEFMAFVTDSTVDAIMCGRGGYGVMRILNLLDFDAIANNPKIIIGFSDITALINAINQKTGLVTFHGPVASSSFNPFTFDLFSRVLFSEKQFSPIKITAKDAEIVIKGSASGKLVGGNLKLLISTLGTPYQIDTQDKILFIEEVSEHPYQIDRMLTQLALSGKLNQCRGIVFGEFNNLNKRLPFKPTKSFTVREIIDQIITPLNVPTVLGMPFGHITMKATIPIGTEAEINANTKTLTILESSVS